MEDAVRACRAIWEHGAAGVVHAPTRSSFTDLWCEPRPVQARLPIWFSGAANDATVRRVAELGDGWLPLAIPLDEVTATIERMRAAFRDRGRDPATLGVRQNLAVKTDDDGPGGSRRDRRPGAGPRGPRRSRRSRWRSAASCAAGPTSSPSSATWAPPSPERRVTLAA